jgi:hypothetical protein
MKRITPIHLEWNNCNGFVFELIGFETDKIEGSLLGLYFSKEFISFSILFCWVPLKYPEI